jgi:acetyltransferase-like isoleucine patch superfamily enzyme
MIHRLRLLTQVPSALWLMLITFLPGSAGAELRYRHWKTRLRFLGVNVLIDSGVCFQNPEFIEIDDNCWIDRNVMILAGPDYSQREKILKRNKHFPGVPGVVHIGKNVHV